MGPRYAFSYVLLFGKQINSINTQYLNRYQTTIYSCTIKFEPPRNVYVWDMSGFKTPFGNLQNMGPGYALFWVLLILKLINSINTQHLSRYQTKIYSYTIKFKPTTNPREMYMSGICLDLKRHLEIFKTWDLVMLCSGYY